MPTAILQQNTNQPKLYLAPMQGLVDAEMRDLLTRIGGFDGCVTEFVRITHTVHNRTTWLKYMPELTNCSQTRAGVSVAVQLLGSNAENMARNALYVAELGADCIDLNFGCPAPTVNQHLGGAILLREPKSIENIVSTVRRNLPVEVMLSAKMRLGYEDKHLALDCARAIENGGAQKLTVHARTKVEGYQPPAHWDWIAKIKRIVNIPIIANGDVFTLEDYRKIRIISECDDVMLGRGAVQRPDLARQIAAYNADISILPMTWHEVLFWIIDFFNCCCARGGASSKYPIARLKQWLAMLKLTYAEAGHLFSLVRTLTTIIEIKQILNQQIKQLQAYHEL